MRIAILGAGPSGLSAASYLARSKEHEIVVFDQAEHLGGLQRSFEHAGVHFDVGTILFTENHGMLDAFPGLREHMVPIKYRPISVTPSGGYDRYPFSVKGYVRDHGLLGTLLAACDLLRCKLVDRRKETVQSYARYYMGSTIYQRSGLKNYIYRLHNMADEELDIEFARKRLNMIERQSIRRMLGNLLPGKRKKTITGPRLVRSPQGFPHLYEEFIGPGLRRQGVEFRLGQGIHAVRSSDQGFEIELPQGSDGFDRVVCTIPINTMTQLVGKTPKVEIKTKNLISLFYKGKFRPPGNTLFNFTLDGTWKRITIFSRFYEPLPDGDDYFTVEVTTDQGDGVAMQQAAEEFQQHARQHSLLNGEPELLGTHLSEDAYPVYQAGQMQLIEAEKQALRQSGIDMLGRQGNFEYVVSNIAARRAKELCQTRYGLESA